MTQIIRPHEAGGSAGIFESIVGLKYEIGEYFGTKELRNVQDTRARWLKRHNFALIRGLPVESFLFAISEYRKDAAISRAPGVSARQVGPASRSAP